jgi:hypothetical protein
MYYKAIFNGTLDFPVHGLKYLVDLLPYTDWQHTAKTDLDMGLLAAVEELYDKKNVSITDDQQNKNILCSWIKRFDSHMLKPKIQGFVTLDMRSCRIFTLVLDEEHEIQFGKWMELRKCKETDKNSPNYFASNYELDTNNRRAA